MDNIFTLFNLLLAGAWGGSKKMFEFAEGVRGILITAGRRARLLDCRPISRVQLDPNALPRNSPQEIEWFSWIETEKRKRLGLSIYVCLLKLRWFLMTNLSVDPRLPVCYFIQRSIIYQQG